MFRIHPVSGPCMLSDPMDDGGVFSNISHISRRRKRLWWSTVAAPVAAMAQGSGKGSLLLSLCLAKKSKA